MGSTKVSKISQEELLISVTAMLEQCEHIQGKLFSVLQERSPIMQRALLQEGKYHSNTLSHEFNYLENELANRRIGIK